MSEPVYCRRCYAVVDAKADACPACGVVSPARRPAVYVLLSAAAGVAAVVTGLFAWVVLRHWDRWLGRIERTFPDGSVAPETAAFVAGAGLFVAAWAAAVWVLRRWV